MKTLNEIKKYLEEKDDYFIVDQIRLVDKHQKTIAFGSADDIFETYGESVVLDMYYECYTPECTVLKIILKRIAKKESVCPKSFDCSYWLDSEEGK